jgi:phosphoenolpyruvate carboxykinase (ATP)
VCHEPEPAQLRLSALARGQCLETPDGMLVLRTGSFVGHAARDQYVVRDELTRDRVAWGPRHQELDEACFAALLAHVEKSIARRESFVLTRHAGGPEGLPVRVHTTSAAHALFCQHLFQARRPEPPGAGLTILHDPDCRAIPSVHGTAGPTFIVINAGARTILIGGTAYAGEIKQAVLSYLSFVLSARGILLLRAAVNVGDWGDSAAFFGLSGTGKTALAADPERHLLGDDAHGWSDRGVFNLEGGCHAKTLGLDEATQPALWRAVHTPLTLIENAALDERTRTIDWHDATLTENTRAAFPLTCLDRVWSEDSVEAPRHVVFLTADALGVLPAVARLTGDQIVYHFLTGYSATLAGTHGGRVEPLPTFSPCFGAPFMLRDPERHARRLAQRVKAARARVWLVNTGWVGGPPARVERQSIAETRTILRAILANILELGPMRQDPNFGFLVPEHVPGARPESLEPRRAYGDPRRYDEQARLLARRFDEQFARHCVW